MLLCQYPDLIFGHASRELIEQYGIWITTYFKYPNMSFGTYTELLRLCTEYLKNYKNETYAMLNIIKIINIHRKQRKLKLFNSFKELLKYWNKQLYKFFVHLSKVCYSQFDIMFNS